MKISFVEKKEETILFKDLRVRDVFSFDNQLYIKIIPIIKEHSAYAINAINLIDCLGRNFCDNTDVIPIESELTCYVKK